MTLWKFVRKSIENILGESLFHASEKKLQIFEDKILHQNPKIVPHPL